jgi:hypothetical protein
MLLTLQHEATATNRAGVEIVVQRSNGKPDDELLGSPNVMDMDVHITT